jgi:arylsulfatase A-like enzyme
MKKQKNALLYFGLLLLGITISGSSCKPDAAGTTVRAKADQRPNIILILADDLGKSAISAYSSWADPTPNIDAWANGGWQLMNYYAGSPVCSPSRASLLLGRPAHQTGISAVLKPSKAGLDAELTDSLPTIATILKQKGYHTNLIGKWHLGYKPENHPLERGFDYFAGFLTGHVDYLSHVDSEGKFGLMKNKEAWLAPKGNHLTSLLTEEAIKIITEENRTAPYFLLLSYGNPHRPYILPGGEPIFPGNSDDFQETRADYLALVSLLDRELGLLHQAVAEQKDNTLIIFLSDNGQTHNTQVFSDLRKSKGTLFEEGVNVPGIIFWPNQIKAEKKEALCSAMDIFPTLIEIASLEKDTTHAKESIYGQNLLRKLEKQQHYPVRLMFQDIRMVRQNEWKAIFVPDTHAKVSYRHLYNEEMYAGKNLLDSFEQHYPLLFNLEEDPDETQNIAVDHQAQLKRLWLLSQNSK